MTHFNWLLPIRKSRYCWVRNVWAFINQGLPRCFPSYGVWLTSQIIRSDDICESVVNNQSISINQFYPIKTSNFIRVFFYFPVVHHRSIFSTYLRGVCYSKKQEVWNLCCSILKLLMVIKAITIEQPNTGNLITVSLPASKTCEKENL